MLFIFKPTNNILAPKYNINAIKMNLIVLSFNLINNLVPILEPTKIPKVIKGNKIKSI